MPTAAMNTTYSPKAALASDFVSIDRIEPQKPEKLALAIPTLREAENLPVLLSRVRAALDSSGIDYEVPIVDDDSHDGTEEIVTKISQEDPRVRLVVRKGERGLSGAILHGWRNTDASILGVMDADLQHPPELLPKLVASIQRGTDLAIGSRYTEGGDTGDWNIVRRLLSAAAVWVTLPIQRHGLRAHDPMTGYFLVRRTSVEGVAFQKSGFKLLLEVLVRARLRSVEEVPFAFGLRSRGASKANSKVALHYAKLLARLYALRFGFGKH
jgi:dolichol-phosphate mannosyltransferase